MIQILIIGIASLRSKHVAKIHEFHKVRKIGIYETRGTDKRNRLEREIISSQGRSLWVRRWRMREGGAAREQSEPEMPRERHLAGNDAANYIGYVNTTTVLLVTQ